MMLQSIQRRVEKLRCDQLIRERLVVKGKMNSQLKVESDTFTDFTSNDYLGVRNDPRVKKALIAGAQQYGFGSGSSAHISGYFQPHLELEERFAKYFKREKAIYFSSGYLANVGVISAIVGRNDAVFLDKYCHASIIDAVILSRARYYRYKHNDDGNLSQLLSTSAAKNKYVISERVFGMEGSFGKVDSIISVVKNKAQLLIDDAHGCGIYDPALSAKDVPLLIAPLGKAFGSCGAVVTGDADHIDAICQLARTYMFNTALPPIIPYATLQSLKIIEKESWRRELLFNNIDFFNREAKKRSLKLVSDDRAPIRCVLAKDINHLNAITFKLKENNMLVSSIRAPTVPKNMPRIRISLSCFHQEDDMVKLLNVLSGFYG